mmetsp:Transcript_21067/g.54756  ORF Transcript_21067/g.54756 Transcript_21067/m.54756 type:complete len:87 (-) Transcript_21067:206-466(-)
MMKKAARSGGVDTQLLCYVVVSKHYLQCLIIFHLFSLLLTVIIAASITLGPPALALVLSLSPIIIPMYFIGVKMKWWKQVLPCLRR